MKDFLTRLADLFHTAESKVVGIYAFAYLIPILVVLIGRIPIGESNIASQTSPFSYYAAFFPLSIVFFVPFASMLPLGHPNSPQEAVASIFWFVVYGGVVFYPVTSYLLLKRSSVAWILSVVSSLVTITIHVFLMSTNRMPIFAVVWSLFGIVTNCVILYLLHSCKAEFIY